MSIIIGLTGGIASGKSTVANMLKERGMTVIDADIEARLAVEKGEKAYESIVEQFGKDILQQDGAIDRVKLGSIIFHHEEKRKQLNSIVHPAVRKRMIEKKTLAETRGEKIIVMDLPLLFENKLMHMVDKTILVYVNESVQLKRLMERNQLSREEAIARIQSQMPLDEKKHLADAVIDNNQTLEETEHQLVNILHQWGLVETQGA
ncbi:dephospho-CoA kinase [Bacillus aquiflavi]|uniref:Dephospho-CoA kinase n=1 Tax=Bacillus aquiflavi TaxID=2672567 RepID=A0A6B3VVY2_9BACI|nr:dephospho-CoA kinase [Bacillus aquiflavi]MBA4537091.1 dephospho-CoA kinase [Bacillus aquiflavi]NEY81388.1 dephospho-CoA kinase [Bacillus aquiflavi]UAC47524.1 dephospho-CoA kinase [Bacillus aquiflavi]